MLFDWNDGGELSTEVDDINKANKKKKVRIKINISSNRNTSKKVIEEGGGLPQDIAKHRQQAFEWAIKVGWIKQEK